MQTGVATFLMEFQNELSVEELAKLLQELDVAPGTEKAVPEHIAKRLFKDPAGGLFAQATKDRVHQYVKDVTIKLSGESGNAEIKINPSEMSSDELDQVKALINGISSAITVQTKTDPTKSHKIAAKKTKAPSTNNLTPLKYNIIRRADMEKFMEYVPSTSTLEERQELANLLFITPEEEYCTQVHKDTRILPREKFPFKEEAEGDEWMDKSEVHFIPRNTPKKEE